MRFGATVEELAHRIGCQPGTVFRAAERAGLPRRPGQVYRLAEIAEGLALLAEDGERAARWDAVRKMCGAIETMFAELAKIAAAIRSKINTNPTGRIPGPK